MQQHQPRFDELVAFQVEGAASYESSAKDRLVGNKCTLSNPDQQVLKRAFSRAVRERRAAAHAYYLERSFLVDRDLAWKRARAVLTMVFMVVVCAVGCSMMDEWYFQLGCSQHPNCWAQHIFIIESDESMRRMFHICFLLLRDPSLIGIKEG